jgi:cytidylate kinase
MLHDADLRVYLTASEDIRSRRIMNREGGSLGDIMAFTAMRDAEDSRRYKELYNIDNNEYSFADLVINVESICPEEIVRIILEKLLERGLVVRG